MQRPIRTPFVLLSSVAVATLALAGCGSDGSTDAADPAPTTIDSTADTTGGAADAGGDDPAATTSGGEPTGRLTLDGETWDLTYDADDPNASCQILVGNTAVVSGMRTPDGNRVDVSVQDIPRDNAFATYYGDDETPLRSAWTEASSEAPEWSIDGSTIRVSGLWVHRTDPSLPEVEGELEVTC